MNKKRTLLLPFVILACGSVAIAQNTNWLTKGNALTATGKLGTTSSKNVDFITNNKSRMTLTSGGDLNINSDQTTIQFPIPGSTPKPMLFMFPSGIANTNRMLIAHSPDFFNYGLQYNDADDRFDFVSDGHSVFNINLAAESGAGVTGKFKVTGNSSFTGDVVIGTANANSSLQVFRGNSGITPLSSSTITTESAGDNFISLLAPTSNKTAILFGTGKSNQDGAIVYNNPAVKSGMQFNTSSSTRMTITGKGFIGIGTVTPATELHVVHAGFGAMDGISHGFRLQNGNGHQWTFFVNGANGELDILKDNKLAGYFDPENGDYNGGYLNNFAAGKQAPDVLQKLMRLSVKQYQPATDKSSSNRFGISVPDAAKVFPEIIDYHSAGAIGNNFSTLSNGTVTAVAIKAIQEQQLIIEELKKEIEDLKATVNKSAVAANNAAIKALAVTPSAYLEQNVPNPFSNTTSISYNLPITSSAAKIIITDKNGKTLQETNVAGGSGSVQVNASSLPNGAYQYSLYSNGKLLTTKQMLISK